jgi:hypothetical protein
MTISTRALTNDKNSKSMLLALYTEIYSNFLIYIFYLILRNVLSARMSKKIINRVVDMPIKINAMLSQTSLPKIPLGSLSLHREPGSLFVSFSSSGKSIFHAGISPDKSYSYATPAKLRQVFSQKKISHVICLDARRVNLYSSTRLSFSPIEPGTLRPENLLKFYKNMRIPCIHSYNGVNLALGDIFELERTPRQFSNKTYSQLLKNLKQERYRDFRSAVKATNLHTHQHECYVENIYKKHGSSSFQFNPLEFFPSRNQIEQFLNLISVLIQHQKTPYIHCGSGTGRTGFYLMCLIIAMTNCTYYQALQLLSHNYSSDVPDEMRHYADYFDLQLPMSCNKFSVQEGIL